MSHEPTLITPAGLRKTLWQTVMHINMGRVQVLNKVALDYPGLVISTSTDKKARTSTRAYYVEGDDREFKTLQDAAKAWNALARMRAERAA